MNLLQEKLHLLNVLQNKTELYKKCDFYVGFVFKTFFDPYSGQTCLVAVQKQFWLINFSKYKLTLIGWSFTSVIFSAS